MLIFNITLAVLFHTCHIQIIIVDTFCWIVLLNANISVSWVCVRIWVLFNYSRDMWTHLITSAATIVDDCLLLFINVETYLLCLSTTAAIRNECGEKQPINMGNHSTSNSRTQVARISLTLSIWILKGFNFRFEKRNLENVGKLT